MGITVIFAALTILGNLIADVGYALLDPRIRFD
jgi:ABC-type dipeptide/oligopeptide/nickel transport system permease component